MSRLGNMERISATISAGAFSKFESARKEKGLNRSEAIEEAIKLYVKAQYARQVFKRTQMEGDDDLAYAESSIRLFAEMMGDQDETEVKRPLTTHSAKR